MLPEIERCQGKVKYDKKGAVTARNLRMKQARIYLRIYPCHLCNGWHLTSEPLIQEFRKKKKHEGKQRKNPPRYRFRAVTQLAVQSGAQGRQSAKVLHGGKNENKKDSGLDWGHSRSGLRSLSRWRDWPNTLAKKLKLNSSHLTA